MIQAMKKLWFLLEGSQAYRKAICWLIGCEQDDYYGYTCSRCGQDYDGFARGLFSKPVYRLRRIILSWPFVRECGNCGKRFITFRDAFCCSQKCYDEWVPF